MSTSVVMPPRTAARVPLAKPSEVVLGEAGLRGPAIGAPGPVRLDGHDPAVADDDAGGPNPGRGDDPAAPYDEGGAGHAGGSVSP